MNTLVALLLIFHLLAMGYTFGASLISLQTGKLTGHLTTGALVALGIGIVMVVLRELQPDYLVDHLKMGIKLVIGLAICYACWDAENNATRTRPALLAASVLLAVNVAVATLV